MKEANKQTVFLITIFVITITTLFVLQFNITGNVISETWCNGADINHDGKVNTTDQNYIEKFWATAIGNCNSFASPDDTYCTRSDLNSDGTVGLGDLTLLGNELGRTDCGDSPVINYCNSSTNGQTFESAPSDGLCSGNNYLDGYVNTTSNGWEWICKSPGTAISETCSAMKKINYCNPSTNGQTFESAPSTNLCTSPADISGSVTTNASSWKWTCLHPGTGISETCSAVNSVLNYCGTSNSQTFDSAPSTNLCSGNNYLEGSITTNAGGWKWNCKSPGTGIEETCSAQSTTTNNGGGSSSSKQTYYPSASNLRTGYNSPLLKVGDKIKFTLDLTPYTFEVLTISTTYIKIKMSSDSTNQIILEDQTRKFELDNDHYYDLQIKLISATTTGAKVTITTINELITSEQKTTQNKEKKEAISAYKNETGDNSEDIKSPWMYIVIGLITLIIFIILLLYLTHLRKKRYEY